MSLLMDDIKYFMKITETLNITRASEIIGISQPALSYAIKRLERELGGELFIRLKSGIRLTKLGEEFKRRCHRLLFEWEQAQKLASPELDSAQGHFTFAIHPSVALYTVGSYMPKIQSKFPQLDISFIHGLSREMTEKVISWEADFGIVVNPVKHPSLVIVRLCHDAVTVFGRKHAPKKLIFDQNLAQSQHILKLIQSDQRYHGSITSQNLGVVAKLTDLGLGYGILPSRVAAEYHLDALPGAPSHIDEVCLVYRPEKHTNAVSKEIIKLIKSTKI
ncbi:MAG: LysR family transcriptional regulator [Pseudobacteriovorax sp.]|nr:LysR family transcriptional regulator [Pseudobacteriovorax sp.]